MEVTSFASQAPSLQNALLLSRGGAATVTATATFSDMLKLSGGGETDSFLTPEGKSVLFMAIAMACHYLGYSIARPVTVSLFTSASTGYKGIAAAFPFAMAFVSPAALFLLMGYTRLLDNNGPRGALMGSTLICALVINLAAVAIGVCLNRDVQMFGIPAVKLITGPLFIFRESYVQLLTSQYWSFFASALTPNQSARWFGPIAGLTSISSAVAGMAVAPLVKRIGLTGALMGTGTMLLVSLIAASIAYNIARTNGFEPTNQKRKELKQHDDAGMIQKASKLFARVPVLKALFAEILSSQGLATVLNVCFVARLGTAIPNDDERAGWVGVYFALINIITMVLQFGVLPPLMTVIEPKALWRVIPIISLLFTTYQSFQSDPTLYIVAASLLVMKVSEYSARRMLDEMIFVPLDFESRFIGKEIISVFGYRFGKSLMSLVISGITTLPFEFGLQQQSILSAIVCASWMGTAWKLSNMVPTRAEAEAAHKRQKR